MNGKKRALYIGIAVAIIFFLILGLGSYCFPIKYRAEIIRYSTQYQLPPALIASVINAESRFRSDATSDKGAIGLMQLLPTTAREMADRLGIEDFDDVDLLSPATNIQLGTYYLETLIEEFGDTGTALCAYNAGPSKVRSWLGDSDYSADGKTLHTVPYPETKKYREKIEFFQKIYAIYFLAL